MKKNTRGILLITSLMLTSMSAAAEGPSKKAGSSHLLCHLTTEEASNLLNLDFYGEFTLRNGSKEPITIEYRDDPTDHLALDIRDHTGKLMPNRSRSYGASMYGQVKLVGEKPQTLTIAPGETYHHKLLLLALVNKDAIAPGKYTVEAVYTLGVTELRSNKVSVEVMKEEDLHCNLIVNKWVGSFAGSFVGVLELRNDSKQSITIEYLNDPMDNLILDVSDHDGNILPKICPTYGGLLAKTRPEGAKKHTFTIKPGEKYQKNLSLFAQTDQRAHPVKPGDYGIEAVYRWGESVSRSRTAGILILPMPDPPQGGPDNPLSRPRSEG